VQHGGSSPEVRVVPKIEFVLVRFLRVLLVALLALLNLQASSFLLTPQIFQEWNLMSRNQQLEDAEHFHEHRLVHLHDPPLIDVNRGAKRVSITE